MAKVSAIDKNKKRKARALNALPKRNTLKNIVNDKNVSMEERFAAVQKLSEMPRNTAMIRVRNRCALTGRPRGNYRFFGLSRNMLRELASSGKLPGVIKASW